MTYRIIGVVCILAIALMGSCYAADSDLKQMSDAGITVSYPPNMESQAKKVLDIAKKQILPAVEINKQLASLLNDPTAIASDIATLLGADELQDKTRARLDAYKQKSLALVGCFSNIRLMETAAAAATEGVDAGALQIRYIKDTDEFKMGLDLNNLTPDVIKRSYYPIFINADGKIRSQDKIAEMAIDQLGSTKAMLLAPVHETIVYMITDQLNLYHPFTRWFTEGVSGWVTRKIIVKLNPKLASLVDQVFMPGAKAKSLKDKVNFAAWPQTAFQNHEEPYIDAEMEVIQTQYAVEAITNLLGGNRSKDLAKIIGILKYNANADSDTICSAIKETMKVDFKKTLLTYVPPDIQFGIDTGEAKKLVSRAEKLVAEKKWTKAEAQLRQALLMAPTDVNARLNLAWIERENNERHDSELQVFLAARLLKQQKYQFHLFVSSLEGNYVLGRLAIMLGNLEYAKKFIEPILQAQPNHQDAKRAMEEIKSLEAVAKGSGE